MVKWQGCIQWHIHDDSTMRVGEPYGIKATTITFTKRYDSFGKAMEEINKIRGYNVILDHQIITLKIYQVPRWYHLHRWRKRRES